MFINKNYAMMRHAYESRDQISPNEELICRKVIGLVAEKIAGKSIRIFHSQLNRAKLTAKIVQSELIALGFTVAEPVGLYWLCDNVNNDNIATVLPENEEEFSIFVSHQPDLEDYLIDLRCRIDNCSVFSEDFVVTRNLVSSN